MTGSWLVFRRFVLGGFIFGSLVLGRLRCSRSILSGFILSCLARSGSVLGRLGLSSFVLGRLRLGCLVRFGLILSWSAMRRYYALAGKLTWLGCCRDCRAPVIHRREHFVVAARRALMACLRSGRRGVRRVRVGFFPGRRSRRDSTRSAVKADVA